MKKPILTRISEDTFSLKMPGYSRKFYLSTEELTALNTKIEKEINQ